MNNILNGSYYSIYNTIKIKHGHEEEGWELSCVDELETKKNNNDIFNLIHSKNIYWTFFNYIMPVCYGCIIIMNV